MPDDSRTIHPVLSNNKRTMHTVPTKNSHMWTQLERNRDTLKQRKNITGCHQRNVSTIHVNLRRYYLYKYNKLIDVENTNNDSLHNVGGVSG